MSLAHQEKTMAERSKVLVVDDEPFNLEIMEEILAEDYEVSYAKSGAECMEIITQVMPDVVLLDVNMPGMSGYEVCQHIKENPKTTNIPVTFVSALDTLAERLAGYEVGGDDYICKPFEASELLSKVSIAVKYKKERESLRVDAELAMQKAMSAVKNTSDYGVLMQFLRSCVSCDSPEKLADLGLYTISSMGLRSSVQIRLGDEMVHKSSDGAINQLERTVVKKISREDQVVDLGVRSVFNFDHVSVLIKNMPMDDKEKYDYVKSNIAMLTEVLELRVLAMLQIRNSSAPRQHAELDWSEVNTIKTRIVELLQTLSQSNNEFRPQYIRILSDLSYKLEDAFSNLEMTEQQEQAIIGLVDGAISEAHALQVVSDNINRELKVLTEQLVPLLQRN